MRPHAGSRLPTGTPLGNMAAPSGAAGATQPLELITIFLSPHEERFKAFAASPEAACLQVQGRALERLAAPVFPTVMVNPETGLKEVAQTHLRYLFEPALWRDHKYKPASVGSAVSHLNAMAQGAIRGGRSAYVLIIEEDIRLSPGFPATLEKVLEWAQSRPLGLVHLGGSSSEFYQAKIRDSELLEQSQRPPVSLRVYPHKQRSGNRWAAIHVAAGFKAYLLGPELRAKMLEGLFRFRLRAVEVDWITQCWEQEELSNERPQSIRAASGRQLHPAYWRCTIVQPPCAEHAIEWEGFWRGSGVKQADAGHAAARYVMVVTTADETLVERMHKCSIGLEVAATLGVGLVLSRGEGSQWGAELGRYMSFDGDAAVSKGVAFFKLIQGDASATRAYFGAPDRVPVDLPAGVGYDAFLFCWNAWAAQVAAEWGLDWEIAQGRARNLLSLQHWVLDTVEETTEKIATETGIASPAVVPLLLPDLTAVAPGAGRGIAAHPKKRARTEAAARQDLAAAALERASEVLDSGGVCYVMAETDADIGLLAGSGLWRSRWCYLDQEAREAVRSHMAGTQRRSFQVSDQAFAQHLGMLGTEQVEVAVGSPWSAWIASTRPRPETMEPISDPKRFMTGYGDVSLVADFPLTKPGRPGDASTTEQAAMVRWVDENVMAVAAEKEASGRRFGRVSAAHMRVLEGLTEAQRNELDEWLSRRILKSSGTERAVLASTLSQSLQEIYPYAKQNAKQYKDVRAQTSGPQWPWFTALLLSVLNFTREAKGSTGFYGLKEVGPGKHIVTLGEEPAGPPGPAQMRILS